MSVTASSGNTRIILEDGSGFALLEDGSGRVLLENQEAQQVSRQAQGMNGGVGSKGGYLIP